MDNEVLAKIVRQYREGQKLSQEEFARAVQQGSGESCSKQAVSLWESGQRRPGYQTLVTLAFVCADWRQTFGRDMLAALRPDVFEPAGEIGRALLGGGQA